ncbi:MAG: tyrosine-type recombinase/integrase [Sphaerochaetaceae bacterium]
MKHEFTITKVTGKTGAVYYYYYAYDEHGNRCRFATGQNNKTRAHQYCMELVRQGKLIPKKSTKLCFKDFAQPFFVWQKCPIVTETLARDGRYSRTFCENNRKCIDKHIIPRFGRLLLNALTPSMINRWLMDLPASVITEKQKKPLAKATCNKQLNLLRQILDKAVEQNLIQENPARKVKPYILKKNPYGAYTVAEMKNIFGDPQKFNNEISYNATLLAATTGMRLGEIRALRREDVSPEKISISHNFDVNYGLKGTKSDNDREVPITPELYAIILSLAPDDGYVFSLDNGNSPVSPDFITDSFYTRMLEALEITEDQRKERRLTFHSWRHFMNTRLIAAGIQGEVTRAIIGHEDESMTHHYLHLTTTDMECVMDVQRKLLA